MIGKILAKANRYRGQVCFGYVCGSTVDAAFFGCVVRLLREDRGRQIGSTIGASHTSIVAAGRNDVVRAFLAQEGPGSEWLLMVDTDMTFAPDLVEKMLATAAAENAKVVSSIAVARRGLQLVPNAFSLRFAEDGTPTGCQPIPYIPAGPCEVDAAGAACMLIHRSVLEAVGKKFGGSWFAFKEFRHVDGKGMETFFDAGEDIVFCLRARAVGEPIVVDPSVRLGHVKSQVLVLEDLDAYKEICSAVGEDNYLASLKARQAGL